MNIYPFFRLSFFYKIFKILVVVFAVAAFYGPAFCGETNVTAKDGDVETFYLNNVRYIKPNTFEVSQNFSEMGGLTRYLAAQDSLILKIVLTPEKIQTAIPFDLTKIKFYDEERNLLTGSFSSESISGSKGPQTDNIIISRSVLYKDGQTMIYFSYIIYGPINKTAKKVFVKCDDADLFSLDIEKLKVE
jgi:hypothetical protein